MSGRASLVAAALASSSSARRVSRTVKPPDDVRASPGDLRMALPSDFQAPPKVDERMMRDKISLQYSSAFIFPKGSRLRLAIFKMTHHRVFEAGVITLIFANCVFLALDDPTVPEDEKPIEATSAEYFFTAVFAVEMLLKIFSQGFILHQGSYLRNGWNVLDFIIVGLSLLIFFPSQFGNYSAMRMLRVLRPLRSINGIQGLKNIVNGLLYSVKKLINVIALAAFLFFIFGIIGVQLFAGRFTFRCQPCVNEAGGICLDDLASCRCNATFLPSVPYDDMRFCKTGARHSKYLGYFFGRDCDAGYDCVDTGINPNHGFTNFDHVGYAFLAIFQCITMEGWVDIMYIVQDTWGNFGCLYFIMLVVLGSFFVLNLALAVINEQFNSIREETERERAEALERMHKALLLAAETLTTEVLVEGDAVLVRDNPDDHWQTGVVAIGNSLGPAIVRTEDGVERTWIMVQPMQDEMDPLDNSDGDGRVVPPCAGKLGSFSVGGDDSHSFMHADRARRGRDSASLNAFAVPPLGSKASGAAVRRPSFLSVEVRQGLTAPEGGAAGHSGGGGFVRKHWRSLRWLCYHIVAHPSFQPTIISCIVLNTGLLAAEHHHQPQALADFFYVANIVLTMIFTVEMLAKLLASGFRGYVEDYFNVLDGVVVIMSLIELGMSRSSSVSVFRALRLLRVFKLLKNFPELRKLIGVCMYAIRDTGYLNIIILLYLFIASLVGMQFFGGQGGTPDSRASFDSFYWAFLAVFQILTRDDWVVVMWDAMVAKGQESAAYFLFLVICGDFLILNLFLAILIQSFDQSMSNHDDDSDDSDDNVEVVPPDAQAGREARARLSLMDDPIVRRASLMFNLAHNPTPNSNNNNGSVMDDAFFPPPYILSARDIKKDLEHTRSSRASLTRSSLMVSDHRRGSKVCVTATPEMPTSPSHTHTHSLSGSETTAHDLHHMHDDNHNLAYTQLLSNMYRPGAWTHCDECGEQYLKQERDGEHATKCDSIRLRKMRSHSLRAVLHRIRSDLHKGGPEAVKTKTYLESVLAEVWEVGLLLDVGAADWLPLQPKAILKILEENLLLVNMRVGEEVVGRALVASVFANRPQELLTNGGNSLCLFGERHPLRLACCAVVKHPIFDNVILACIIVSSLLMASENPRYEERIEDTAFGYFLEWTNIMFTAIFVVEMMLKLVVFGLLFGKDKPDPPYLRDWWNVMDGMIVIVSVLAISLASSSQLSFFKVFRTFRALRPLRVISRNRGLRMVVITLMQSIGGIGNVALISFLVFLVFGILGVQLLNGKLYHCTDVWITNRQACYGYYLHPDTQLMLMRRWTNKREQNFDNIFSALLTLFEVSTLELWSIIMYHAMDAVSKDEAPEKNANKFIALFFVVFVVVGSFFILNLFVGVVIHNYNEVKVREDGLHFLSVEQKLWIETQRMMLNFKPVMKMKEPKQMERRRCFRTVQSPYFDIVIGVCITLNIIVMSLESDDMSESMTFVTNFGNWLFSGIFLLEATFKIVAYSLAYFQDSWNRFDFFLVLLSILDLFLVLFESSGLPINASFLRVLRIFRIMRILRLVKAARDVRILLETVWYSLPSIANIGMFLGLLFFIYAILGVNLFAQVRRGEFLTYHANFETFPNAIMLLFRMVTGENWNGVMRDTMVEPPHDCNATGKVSDCGNSFLAPFYYTSFLLIAGFVLINLFVAIILDNFGTTMQIERSELRFNDLHKFIDIWADFDPTAKLTIKTLSLPKFLEKLGPPLGITRRTSRLEILRRTGNYCIPEHGGVIHFIETIIPLARHCMNEKWRDSTEHRDLRDQEDSWRQAFPDINDLPVLRVRQRRVTVDQYFASTYIAAAYRRRRAMETVSKMKTVARRDLLLFNLWQVKAWNCLPSEAYTDQDVPMPGDTPVLKKPENIKTHMRRMVKMFEALYGFNEPGAPHTGLWDADLTVALVTCYRLVNAPDSVTVEKLKALLEEIDNARQADTDNKWKGTQRRTDRGRKRTMQTEGKKSDPNNVLSPR